MSWGWKSVPVRLRRGFAVLTETGDEALGQFVQGGGLDVRVEILTRELVAHRFGEVAFVEAAGLVGEVDRALLDDAAQTDVGGACHGRSRSCHAWSISASAVMA